MSIKKINEFPEGSGTLTSDDIFLFMDDPGNSGITKKISLTELSTSFGSLPASGLSITLGGGWWVGSPKQIFNYVPPQAVSFDSSYQKYSGKWITTFGYSESGYTTGTRLTSITFNDLEGVTGNFSPTTCAGLTSITANSLAYIGGGFAPSTMTALTSLSFTNLSYILGNFAPSNTNAITSFSFPNLVYIGGGFNVSNQSSVTSSSFPKLAYLGSMTIFSLSGTWSSPLLAYVGSINMNSTTPSILSFPALSTINGSISLTLPSVSTLSFPALAYWLGGISVSAGASSLTSFTLPVDGTLKLVTGAINFASGVSVPLSQTSVDNILQALASLDGTNGTTYYGGQAVTLASTGCAAPSNAGSTTTAGSNFVCSGTTCTVNWTGHGYATGDVLRISGITTATNANKYAVIIVANANQFSYTITSQTATGAGTATVVKAGASAKALVSRANTLTTN